MKYEKGNYGDWSEILYKAKIIYDNWIIDTSNTIHNIVESKIDDKTIRNNGSVISVNNIMILNKEEALNIIIKGAQELKLSSGRSFYCPSLRLFFTKLGISKIKSSSECKNDMIVEFDDIGKRSLTFKSNGRSRPAWINASKPTNFRYKIIGGYGSNLNTKNLIKDIYNKGGYVEFDCVPDHRFSDNIGSSINAIAMINLEYYKSVGCSVDALIDSLFLNKDRVCDLSKQVFIREVKEFLLNFSCDYTPTKKLSDSKISSGGLVWMSKTGDMVCDITTNKRDFRDLIYRTAEMDTGSTKRHAFGSPFILNGSHYILLNLSVREGKE